MSSLAAPSSIAACISCPQACMLPFSERNGRSVFSRTLSASISARSRIPRPARGVLAAYSLREGRALLFA